MRPIAKTKHALRCNCNTRPLLAMYGVDEENRLYLHIKIYKQNRIYGEVYTHYSVSLLCRMCGRWWNINVRSNNTTMTERRVPMPLEM